MDAARYPPELRRSVERAFSRTLERLERGAPTLSTHVLEWMRSLSQGASPATYFTHPQAFPMLLLPRWLEASLDEQPDATFQEDLVYSTINGYYFVRMIDDLMDGESVNPLVMPALIFFHTEFQGSYHRHFAHDHPFWEAYASASLAAAETASYDANLEVIGREQFRRISARKISGVKVPIAAVCHRYGRLELLESWYRFIEAFGCWHQMQNDVLGWSRDLTHARVTYFLSEAAARKGNSASIPEWVIFEGLRWAQDELALWMRELRMTAFELDCPPLIAYVEQRDATLAREWEQLNRSLTELARAGAVLR